MAKVQITIDGQVYLAESGNNFLAEALSLGVDIPHLCYDPRIKPFGACRLCYVELRANSQLVTACSLKVEAGMDIITNSESVRELRVMALELLMAEHCGDCLAPCQRDCPAGVDIQGFIAHLNNQDYLAAGKLIRETMPMPSVCGRVCPRFCEDACRRSLVDEAVDICGLKRFAGDLWLDKIGDVSPQVKAATDYKVAVVGGGPAGLTVAYYLGLAGHQVTLLDAGPKLGGMLRYGIPEYRLPNEILDQEIAVITSLCQEVIIGKELGKDYTLEELKADFDAVFLGIGCQEAQMPGLEKQDLSGIYSGIEFLRQVRLGEETRLGKRVAVIGGGNTAMDAARTAIRLGVEEVMVFYRRSQEEMPAEPIEIAEAVEEGVEFHFLTNPTAFIGNDQVEALQLVKMELGPMDASGRRRPIEIADSEYRLAVDNVILALGQKVDQDLIAKMDVEKTRWGSFTANPAAGVFAAGDCVTGAATVVEAIGVAHKIANKIDSYLTGKPQKQMVNFDANRGKLDELDPQEFDSKPKITRSQPQMVNAEERIANFAEYSLGYRLEEVNRESSRCLSCGCLDVGDCQLRNFADQYKVGQENLGKTQRRYELDQSHPYIHRDQNKCILCGRCVLACKELAGYSVLGFVDRGFETTVEPALGKPLVEVCQSCGLCATVCPTGALTFNYPWVVRGPWQNERVVETTCLQCNLGCGLEISLVEDKIVAVRSPENHPVSNGVLCQKGSFNYDFLYNNRLTVPMHKMKNKFVDLAWYEAGSETVKRLKQIQEQHGKDSIGLIASGNLTNEEYQLLADLASQFGTKNIGTLSNYLSRESLSALAPPQLTLSQLSLADLIIVINTDLQHDYLPLASRLYRYHQAGGEVAIVGKQNNGFQSKDVTHLELDQNQIDQLVTALHLTTTKSDLSRRLGIKELELIQRYIAAENPLIILDQNSLDPVVLGILSSLVPSKNLLLLQQDGNIQGSLGAGFIDTNLCFAQIHALVMVGDGGYRFTDLLTEYKFDFIATITPHLNEGITEGDIILPGSTFLETAGTAINYAGQIQNLAAINQPPSGRSNSDILRMLLALAQEALSVSW